MVTVYFEFYCYCNKVVSLRTLDLELTKPALDPNSAIDSCLMLDKLLNFTSLFSYLYNIEIVILSPSEVESRIHA